MKEWKVPPLKGGKNHPRTVAEGGWPREYWQRKTRNLGLELIATAIVLTGILIYHVFFNS